MPWLTDYPEGVDWKTSLHGESLAELFDRSAADFSDRTCIDFLGKTTSYKELSELVDKAACGLESLGVGKGTKIGILLPNCPAFAIYFFAALKTGATVVNCNPLYTVEELEHQVRDSKTDFLVTLDLAVLLGKADDLLGRKAIKKVIVCSFADMLPKLKSILFRLLKSKDIARPEQAKNAERIMLESQLIDNDGAFQPARINPEKDVAVLQYTSGTTGTPKGAMLSHANLTINIQQINMWTQELLGENESILGVLPLFHIFAMTTVLNFGIARGYKLILLPRFDLDQTLKTISKTQPTIFPGVPTIYNAILNHSKAGSLDMSSLKFCISGGAALPSEVKREFEDLTGCALVEGYGLSETSPVATCNPARGDNPPGSIGLPFPGTTISIRSIDDPKKEMPLGENGEICIAGPQVMSGYWEKPNETKDAFVGKFFRTGDVGYMDERGYIFIVDRMKDMINASGFKIYPRRIEEAIYEIEAVEEVTVIGVPDEYRGEAPAAYIKLRKGKSLTADDVLAFLEPKISKIEMPRDIEFRDELPKTMIGKLSKKELREERGDA